MGGSFGPGEMFGFFERSPTPDHFTTHRLCPAGHHGRGGRSSR